MILAASLGVAAWFQQALPERVPTHWNWKGEIDGWGPRWQATWMISGVLFGIAALTLGLPLLGPFRRNFEKFRGTYGAIVTAVLGTFLGLQTLICLASSGANVDIGAGICVFLGGLFVLLGNWFGKIRRNFYVGIRTPWTLANDYVWERTHRLGGKMFVGVGAMCILAGLLLPAWVCFIVMMGGLIGSTAVSIVYSLICYRRHGQIDELGGSEC
ncbi:MAG: SdpI family protein [Phycisphaerales bacterium]|nr:SdpI family protein [Phycisphaerales bacterium]